LGFSVQLDSVIGGTGGLTANIHTNVKPLAVHHNRPGTTVNVGNAGSLSGILGEVQVANSQFPETLTVDDSADGATHNNVVVTLTNITGLAPATISLPLTQVSLTISTGTGTNTVNVRSTSSVAFVMLIGHSDATTVNVGDSGSLALIQSLSVSNPPRHTLLNVDDSADSRTHNNVVVTGSSIGGLAPDGGGFIGYQQNDLSALNISTGTGTNTVNVQSTPHNSALVHTALIAHSVATTVNVGNAGSLSGILGELDITNPPSYNAINVDGSADAPNHNDVVVTASSITGLATAPITYQPNGITALNISTGTGTNTVNVRSTPFDLSFPATTLIGHSAATTVNVGNAGSLSGILGELDVSNATSLTRLNVDDSADNAGQTATFNVSGSTGSILGLAPAAINYTTTSVGSLTVNGGSGGNVFNIERVVSLPSGGTTVNAGTGGPGDCFHIAPTDQRLEDIAGPLTLGGSGSGLDILDFFDQNNPASETYTFDSVPSNLTMTTEPVSINFNGFAGTSVYLETNGFSTVNDASGMVNVDVQPPCGPASGTGEVTQITPATAAGASATLLSDIPKHDATAKDLFFAAVASDRHLRESFDLFGPANQGWLSADLP
jgi:hypothetical protein